MMTNHHRRPVSEGGTRDPRNISRVHDKLHKAWHLLFANKTPYEIANICNQTWLDPEYEFVVKRKLRQKFFNSDNPLSKYE